MPYLKFARDKRGYENFYLMEPPSGRDSNARPRVLFWFRTPPNVKVGRVPFSREVREMIEAQNPDVTFDWDRIMSTPIPPPDVDYWRERRRAEKAARRAAREDEEDAVEAETAVDEAEAEPVATAQETTSAVEDVEAVVEAIETRDTDETDTDVEGQDELPAETPAPTSDVQAPAPNERRHRRRRRRGGRRRHGHQRPDGQPGTPSSEATSVQQDAAPPDKGPSADEV